MTGIRVGHFLYNNEFFKFKHTNKDQINQEIDFLCSSFQYLKINTIVLYFGMFEFYNFEIWN